jgi:hypothetical protein
MTVHDRTRLTGQLHFAFWGIPQFVICRMSAIGFGVEYEAAKIEQLHAAPATTAEQSGPHAISFLHPGITVRQGRLAKQSAA